MRGYGLGYWEVMKLPLMAFWMLDRNLDRLRAEEDLRQVETEVAVKGDGKTIESFAKHLQAERGRVAIGKAKLDKKGLAELKGLGRAV